MKPRIIYSCFTKVGAPGLGIVALELLKGIHARGALVLLGEALRTWSSGHIRKDHALATDGDAVPSNIDHPLESLFVDRFVWLWWRVEDA